MTPIIGISYKQLPFETGNYIGTLLHHEFPTTLVFADTDGTPVIKEWADCSDDGTTDRYFSFRTSKSLLKRFIEKQISHFDLLQLAENGIGFITDESNNEVVKITALASNKLPQDYLPDTDYFFSESDGVNTAQISAYFGLSEITTDDDFISDIAETHKSEIYNLHILQGKGVGYGRINVNILGDILSVFNRFYKNSYFDFEKGATRGEPSRVDKKIHPLEVVLERRASYSIYVRPKFSEQTDFIEGESESAKIANQLFTLFSVSENESQFREHYNKFSSFTINSYNQLLKTIAELEIKIDIKWIDAHKTRRQNKYFDSRNSTAITDTIQKIRTTHTEKFDKEGKFIAINTKTGSFSFTALDKSEYSGYFEKRIREQIALVTFTNLYLITVERSTVKTADKNKDEIENIISAYYKIEKEPE